MFSWKLLLSILLAGVISIWAHMSYKSSVGVSLDSNSPNKAQPSLFLLNVDSLEKVKQNDKKGNRAIEPKKDDLTECTNCGHTRLPILDAFDERNKVRDSFIKSYIRYTALNRDLCDKFGCKSAVDNAITNEVTQETLFNMQNFRFFLYGLMSKLKICFSTLGLNNPNRKKPNYEQIFCDELESPDIQELYTDLKHELSKTAKTRSILSSFEECMAIIRSQAKMCSDKWDWEQRIEKEAKGGVYYRNNLPSNYDAHDMAYGAQMPENNDEEDDEMNDKESADSIILNINNRIRRHLTIEFVAKTEYDESEEVEEEDNEEDNDKRDTVEAREMHKTEDETDTCRENSAGSEKEETAEATEEVSGEGIIENEFEPEVVNENEGLLMNEGANADEDIYSIVFDRQRG